MTDTVAPEAAPAFAYVVTADGYGYARGATLTNEEAESAKERGTLDLFTVRIKKGA
ncbi:hypothetical protein [Gluconobacter oxydans]|uniref:hypothetical protein n=1 Tax=Gluconobacter oxydans TaxID=442 RepID=UPI0003162558|nr:hypothetical protein [Gluconobacter oxydans]